METIRTLYKTGNGPSSSHTMGPQKAAAAFLIHAIPKAELYTGSACMASLAATGKGAPDGPHHKGNPEQEKKC